jgi:hypothetical protein
MISISGVFAVTFSVVFAYVADVTEEQERSLAYGLVSVYFGRRMYNVLQVQHLYVLGIEDHIPISLLYSF